MSVKKSVSVFGAVVGLVLAACQTPGEQAPASAGSNVKLSSRAFIEMVGSGAPNVMCSDNPQFRQCLQISEDRCLREVREVMPKCQAEMLKSMPAYLENKGDAGRYGRQLGECVAGKIILSGRYDLKQLKNCKNM